MRFENAILKVGDLQKRGVLRVEDGNHGEYRPRREEFSHHGVSFIRAADIDEGRILFESASRINTVAFERIRKGIGQPGDIILTHKGTVGKLAMAPESAPSFVCSPQTTFWRVLDESVLDRWYLYAYMDSPEFRWQLDSRKGETDMAGYVSLTAQRQLTIRLPDMTVQRAIGTTVRMFDERLSVLRQINATLQSIAQAIFKSWFVDFDPVHAKAVGQEPIGIDADTAALFPREFEDSELGPIPKGWRWDKFENVLELAYGRSLRADRRIPGPVTVMGSNGPVGTHNEKLVSGPGIVVGRKGNAGTVRWVDEDFFPIDTTFYVVPKSDLPLRFLYFALEAADLPSLSADSAVPGLNRSFAYSCPVLVPSKEIVMVFDGLFNSLRSKVAENIGLMNTLAALRDTLLPRLISGKLRIPEAEAIVEEALP